MNLNSKKTVQVIRTKSDVHTILSMGALFMQKEM